MQAESTRPPHPRRLTLPAVAGTRLEAAWREGRRTGVEPCGYLLGTAEDGVLHVAEVRAGRNVHPRPATAFALAPGEHLAVRREARAAGLRVLGCWHGHLQGAPRPSRADAAGLGPLGPHLALLVGHGPSGAAEVRAWLRADEAWVELAIEPA